MRERAVEFPSPGLSLEDEYVKSDNLRLRNLATRVLTLREEAMKKLILGSFSLGLSPVGFIVCTPSLVKGVSEGSLVDTTVGGILAAAGGLLLSGGLHFMVASLYAGMEAGSIRTVLALNLIAEDRRSTQ